MSDALRSCLDASGATVHLPGDPEYDEAKLVKNKRADIVPSPAAVARVRSVSDVKVAVICAFQLRYEACARAGGGHAS